MGLMECSECEHIFDLVGRIPKLLPCGHTLCDMCVTDSYLSGDSVTCPICAQVFFYKSADLIQDDLQLLCWIEATSQGVLECFKCRYPFDRLVRRPAALGCGHSVCRVCLLDQADISPGVGTWGSEEEFWEYNQDDCGDSATSLHEEDGLVNCPMDGCLLSVNVRDHQHLLDCLDGGTAVKRKSYSRKEDNQTELVRTVCEYLFGKLTVGAIITNNHLQLLLPPRGVAKQKNSPRSELPGLCKQQYEITEVLGSSQVSLTTLVEERPFEKSSLKVECDVSDVSQCCPGKFQVRKEAMLLSDEKVLKLTGLDCMFDPEWSLRLLRRAAPDLKELQLRYPSREHLEVIRNDMPHLRHLEVRGWLGADLPQEHVSFDKGQNRSTLESLDIFLPTSTATSLIRAHRRSLRAVRIMVAEEWDGTPPLDADALHTDDDEDDFCVVSHGENVSRSNCLDQLLAAFSGHAEEAPTRLSSVSLEWTTSRMHDSWLCGRFARAMRQIQPDLSVECGICHSHRSNVDRRKEDYLLFPLGADSSFERI